MAPSRCAALGFWQRPEHLGQFTDHIGRFRTGRSASPASYGEKALRYEAQGNVGRKVRFCLTPRLLARFQWQVGATRFGVRH